MSAAPGSSFDGSILDGLGLEAGDQPPSMSKSEFQAIWDRVAGGGVLASEAECARFSQRQYDRLLMAAFKHQLSKAEKRFRSGENQGRDGAINALAIVQNAIEKFIPEFSDHLGPLEAIGMALIDLNEGKSPALFERGEKGQRKQKSEKPQRETYHKWIQGAAAAAVTLFLEANPRLSRNEACRKVAQAFNNSGWKKKEHGDQGKITVETVLSWRKATMGRRPKATARDEDVLHYNMVLNAMRDTEPDLALSTVLKFLQRRIPKMVS